LTGWLFDDDNIDPFNSSEEEFRNEVNNSFTDGFNNVQPIEIINVEDNTGNFPRQEQVEAKMESTSQTIDKHYENSEPTPEEITEYEGMITVKSSFTIVFL
jgi:hypothetical protein